MHTQEILSRNFKGVWISRQILDDDFFKCVQILEIAQYMTGERAFCNIDWPFLEKNGYVIKKSDCPHAIKEFIISSKIPQKYKSKIAVRTCSWCEAESCILHAHHFPFKKSQGGIVNVNICPNCHAEFHFLENYYVFTDKILDHIKIIYEGDDE